MFEEAAIAFTRQVVRAEAAEKRVAELEAEVKALKEKLGKQSEAAE